MSLYDDLRSESVWREFLAARAEAGRLREGEIQFITDLIDSGEYRRAVDALFSDAPLPHPEMRAINKSGTDKKRLVFLFPEPMKSVLKVLAHRLHALDGLFCPNLYSFRRYTGVKDALDRLRRETRGRAVYAYKVDIHDYFNSVDVKRLMPLLAAALKGEPEIFRLLRRLLSDPIALVDGVETPARKGIMAGMPVSGFLANLYLSALDAHFAGENAVYARYSDDIIVFSETRAGAEAARDAILSRVSAAGLTVNPRKERLFAPDEGWEFLGFSVKGEVVDICPAGVCKLKAKMRRKARALIRWRIKKNLPPEAAERAFIRHFSRKFYACDDPSELTWSRWYFPTITTDASLRALDDYMVQCLRFIGAGRHGKTNYRLRYADIRALGFRSLVNAYYRFRANPPVKEIREL